MHPRLIAPLRSVALGPRTLLWSDATGRGLWDSPGARSVLATGEGPPALVARMAALGLIDGGPPVDRRVPCRSHHALLLPDESVLWCADPMQPTPGGFRWHAEPLGPAEVALWRACNGARSLAEAARFAGTPLADALAFAARLTRLEVQALQLRALPAR